MSEATGFFSKLRTPSRNADQCFENWEEDLCKLIQYGVVTDPDVLFMLRWNIVQEDWDEAVPVLLKRGGDQLERLLLYYWLTGKFAGDFKMTEFLFRRMPVNMMLSTTADVGRPPSARMNLKERAIRINIPIEETLPPDGERIIRTNFARDFIEMELDGGMGGTDITSHTRKEIEGDWYACFNNAHVQKYSKNKFVSKIPSTIVQRSENDIFNTSSQDYLNLRGKLESVFRKLANASNYPNWASTIEGAEYDAFIKVSALNALSIASSDHIEETRHYPSTDALEPPEGNDKEEGSYREVASGGVIIHLSGQTTVKDWLLTTLLNLRNRASSIEQHKQKATLKIMKEARRSAIAAIMSRNMSHNIGSHVLASPDLLKEGFEKQVLGVTEKGGDLHDGMRAGRMEVQSLHSYLQQRMDFIAQVVSYTPSWGEPMFFFGDLLRGFIRQRLLLGFLIRDQGYGGEKISFTIHHGAQKRILRVGKDSLEQEAGGDNATGIESLRDFLVSIPGGSIGAHAFYDILENTMRNSAKYGVSADEMRLHLRIEPFEEDRYIVTLWDNLSPQKTRAGNRKDRVRDVKKHLVAPLISSPAEDTVVEGRGLQEVKECARILTHPYGDTAEWKFEVESDGTTRDLPVTVDAYSDEDQEAYLAYQFYMQNPHLVGIAYPDRSSHVNSAEEETARRAGLYFYAATENLSGALKPLTKYAHQFGIIWMPEGPDEQEEVVSFIGENQHLLPYRLLLATSQRELLRDEVRNQGSIPPRRIHWCEKKAVGSILDECRADRKSAADWKNAVISIYGLWIQQFKPLPAGEKWQIVIMMERGEDYLPFERWRDVLGDFKSNILDLHIGRFSGGRSHRRASFEVEISTGGISDMEDLAEQIENGPQRFIVIDNHGAGLRALEKNTNYIPNQKRPQLACYHEAGLKQAFKLHQTLESPPQDFFGASYLLLGLVESALTNVLVVDERISESTFTKDHGLATPYHLLETLRNTNTYPIYSLWTNASDGSCERTFVSEAIAGTHEAFIKKEEEYFGIHSEEGLYLRCDSGNFVRRQSVSDGITLIHELDKDKDVPISQNDHIDAVVVHQGVLDRLSNFNRWHPNEDLEALYQIAPTIIVTSGRGRNLRSDITPETLPFVEFSTIRETTYADTSKYHLVRALFSVKGKQDNQD